MNKKQTIRKKAQPAQKTPKKLNKELDLELDIESDNNIENDFDDFDGNNDVILETKKNKSKNPDVKKKRVISDDQKKILIERLAYARSIRKKESENKKA